MSVFETWGASEKQSSWLRRLPAAEEAAEEAAVDCFWRRTLNTPALVATRFSRRFACERGALFFCSGSFSRIPAIMKRMRGNWYAQGRTALLIWLSITCAGRHFRYAQSCVNCLHAGSSELAHWVELATSQDCESLTHRDVPRRSLNGAGEGPFSNGKVLTTDLFNSSTVHTAVSKATRMEVLEAVVAKHSSNFKLPPPDPPNWTPRFRRFSQSWVLSQRGSCRWTLCVQMNEKISPWSKPNLSRGNLEVQNARDTLRDCFGALFIQQLAAPEVYKSSGGTGPSDRWTARNRRKYFSKNVAGLYPCRNKSEAGYQKIAQKIKIEQGLQGTRCEAQGARERSP